LNELLDASLKWLIQVSHTNKIAITRLIFTGNDYVTIVDFEKVDVIDKMHPLVAAPTAAIVLIQGKPLPASH